MFNRYLFMTKTSAMLMTDNRYTYKEVLEFSDRKGVTISDAQFEVLCRVCFDYGNALDKIIIPGLRSGVLVDKYGNFGRKSHPCVSYEVGDQALLITKSSSTINESGGVLGSCNSYNQIDRILNVKLLSQEPMHRVHRVELIDRSLLELKHEKDVSPADLNSFLVSALVNRPRIGELLRTETGFIQKQTILNGTNLAEHLNFKTELCHHLSGLISDRLIYGGELTLVSNVFWLTNYPELESITQRAPLNSSLDFINLVVECLHGS